VEEVVQVGKQVWVKVIDIKEERGQKKLSLSMKTVAQVHGTDMDPDNCELPQARGGPSNFGGKGGKGGKGDGKGGGGDPNVFPTLYSIHMGTVQSNQTFGSFIEMDGFRSNGLVHMSQLAGFRVESAEDVVSTGDRVWVKVIAIKDDDEKGRRQISLSMKYVDQSDGNDLDPLHEGAEADAENRRPPPGLLKKMDIDAALLVPEYVRAGRGGAEDQSGNAGYELIPEPEVKMRLAQ
jgi:predicted RNA-binding protein with RPS1 domain